MISVIICSRRSDISAEQRQNIESTIGVGYEIVAIDNSDNHHNIFSAYNEGVRRSRYGTLCFIHDDVLFHKEGWGRTLLRYFEDPGVGLVGISGPLYFSSLPSTWWGGWTPSFTFHCISECVIATDRNNRANSRFSSIPAQKPAAGYADVVVCDGILLAIPKRLFDEISFDEATYSGFHFYDLDISMQVFTRGYRCLASYELGVEHISSPASMNRSWVEESAKFYAKWGPQLPLSTARFSLRQRLKMQVRACKTMKLYLRRNGSSVRRYHSAAQLLRITWLKALRMLRII